MDLGNHDQFDAEGDWRIDAHGWSDLPGRSDGDTAEILRLALTSADAGVWERDLNTGIVRLSPRSRQICGLPETHSGLMSVEEWMETVDVRDRDRVVQWAGDLESRVYVGFIQLRIRRPDGEVRWLRASARVLCDADGRPRKQVGLQFDETDHRHAEEALRESEAHFRLVQDAALIGTFSGQSSQEAIGSPQYFRNLGLPEDMGSIDPKIPLGLVHPDDRANVECKVAAALEERVEGFDLQYRINRADTGETRWIFCRTKFEWDDDGRLLHTVGAHLDITDPKLARQALRESEERLRLIQDAALIGTYVTDADDITIGSRQFYRNLGLPEDTTSTDAETHRKLVHPDDWDRLAKETEKAMALGRGLDTEFRICRADTGELRWILARVKFERDDQGRPIRSVGAHVDITEHKLAQQALQESEDRLSLVQEAALIGTFVTDSRLRCVGSKQFYRNLGLPEDTGCIEVDDHLAIVHPDDRAKLERELKGGLQSDIVNFDCQFRIVRPENGEIRWIFSRSRFERGPDGRLARIVGAHLDVTESKAAQDALRETEERLGLMQEAVQIGTYTHDFGKTCHGSKQYYRNLGLPEDIGHLDRDRQLALIHPDDRIRTEQDALAALQSGADGYDTTYRIFRADTGETRWIFSRIKFRHAEDGSMAGIFGAHLDVTDSKLAQAALDESRALNQGIMEASADCVKLLELDGRLCFMNQHGLRALEVEDASAILGKPWLDILPRAEHHKAEIALEDARQGLTGHFSGMCPTVGGKRKWWDVMVTPIHDRQGRITQLLAISRDVTEHLENLAQIRWTASHDMLTGLPNRRYFHDRLDKVLTRAAARGSQVGLMQLDLDDFKQINDALGHDAGDMLLKEFTRRLQSAVGRNETVARLGGDEFAIIVPKLSDKRPLSHIVENIQKQLARPFVYQGRVFDCRASVGKAIYPEHGATADELLKNADIALYAAKGGGRGCVRRFHSSMRSELQARSNMVHTAREALDDDRVYPFYQPKIDFATGAPRGFEALLRWQDRSERVRSPAEIAAAFEDLDVALAISERIQVRVLSDIRRWLDDGVDVGRIAINASAAEFRQDDFAESLLSRIEAARVPTSSLELEVTETVFLGKGAEYVDRALKQLSAAGIHIALDDFGTGYASLSHLKQFPVDTIKIDQSFVRNLEVNPDDSAIVEALIGLGKSLSIEIVAEGIENQAQAAFLSRRGCDYGQGYLFSEAVAASRVPALIAALTEQAGSRQRFALGLHPQAKRMARAKVA